jgi:hypothetical protein
MALQKDLINHVARSLGEAYRVNPDEVEQILIAWRNSLRGKRPSEIKYTEQSDYEKRLATIALIYGWIEDAEGISEKGFDLLKYILVYEKSPFVRGAVTAAVRRQAERDFEKVAPKIQRLTSAVADREEKEIVEVLNDIYFDRRSKMTGGDHQIKARGRLIPVWTDGTRPKTEIEKVIEDWIKDSSYPVAQRIAVKARIAFAKFDQEENQKIDDLLDERRRDAERTKIKEVKLASDPSNLPKKYAPDMYTNWVLWLISINKPDGLSSKPENLLHEILAQRAIDRPTVEFDMEKMRRSADPELVEIAKGLDRAVWWIDNKSAVLKGGCLVGLIVILYLMYRVFFFH